MRLESLLEKILLTLNADFGRDNQTRQYDIWIRKEFDDSAGGSKIGSSSSSFTWEEKNALFFAKMTFNTLGEHFELFIRENLILILLTSFTCTYVYR
jgi:prolyl oligopeptidase PreP (S9A serine peptidase family)